MEPIVLPGFAGPANALNSPNADAEDLINLFIESTPPGTGKIPKYIRGTPGVRPFATGPDGTIRAAFSQDGRAFALSGGRFIEVDVTGTGTDYGPVLDDGLPGSMASNGSAGNQVMALSGGLGYIFDLGTNTLTQISDTDFPADASQVEFMDGYFLVTIKDTRRFQISALEDGLTWDALDVAERSEGSDNIVSMIRNHREIWFLGSKTGEVWYDNGDPDFPFAPIQGVFVEQGSAATFSICRRNNTIAWLGADERGNGVVYEANGYTPEQVSTYAVEDDIQAQGSDLDQTIAFANQMSGHVFSWMQVPSLPWTWVYDATEKLWHKRAIWDADDVEYLPYVGSCYMFAFGKHLLGSRLDATIYELNVDYFDDSIVAA
jgi:hypothetical protein